MSCFDRFINALNDNIVLELAQDSTSNLTVTFFHYSVIYVLMYSWSHDFNIFFQDSAVCIVYRLIILAKIDPSSLQETQHNAWPVMSSLKMGFFMTPLSILFDIIVAGVSLKCDTSERLAGLTNVVFNSRSEGFKI